MTNFLDWLLFETDSAARNCRKRRRLAVSIKCGDIVAPKRKIVAQFAGRSECNPSVLRYDVVERSGPTKNWLQKIRVENMTSHIKLATCLWMCVVASCSGAYAQQQVI